MIKIHDKTYWSYKIIQYMPYIKKYIYENLVYNYTDNYTDKDFQNTMI